MKRNCLLSHACDFSRCVCLKRTSQICGSFFAGMSAKHAQAMFFTLFLSWPMQILLCHCVVVVCVCAFHEIGDCRQACPVRLLFWLISSFLSILNNAVGHDQAPRHLSLLGSLSCQPYFAVHAVCLLKWLMRKVFKDGFSVHWLQWNLHIFFWTHNHHLLWMINENGVIQKQIADFSLGLLSAHAWHVFVSCHFLAMLIAKKDRAIIK